MSGHGNPRSLPPGYVQGDIGLRARARDLPTYEVLSRRAYNTWHIDPNEHGLHFHFHQGTYCLELYLVVPAEYNVGEYFLGNDPSSGVGVQLYAFRSMGVTVR